MDIKTNQIGDLLRDQIKNIDDNVDVNEVGGLDSKFVVECGDEAIVVVGNFLTSI